MGKSSSIKGSRASVRIDNWAVLKPIQRVDLCRRSADEALKSASATRNNMKEEYERLAANWISLAQEIEISMNGLKTFRFKRSA
jgi:hypothetical protein